MGNVIQMKRGAKASLPTLNAGEFGFSTDTHQVYIGDGAENHEVSKSSDLVTTSGVLQTSVDENYETLIDYSAYKSTNSFFSNDLLIYYGYTNSFNYPDNAWTNEKVAVDMARYNMIVFGNGVANTGHSDYANFIIVITRVRELKPGIKLFGYVTLKQTLANFKTKADEWAAVSQIDGVFIDEAGYDHGKTRSDLNNAVDYVHGLSCNTCFVNSWVMEHIIGITNDPSYPNSTYNTTSGISNLTDNDWYLLESFPCNTTSYSGTAGYCTMVDWLSRGNKATANRDEFGINLASVSVIDKSDSNDTTLFDFHYLTALTFALDAQGSSDTLYASSSAIVPFHRRMSCTAEEMGLIYEINPSVTVATDNWQIHYRYTDKGKLVCDHTGSDPIITFTSSIGGGINKIDAGAANYAPSTLTSDYIITVNTTAAARSVTISTEDRDSGNPRHPRLFVIKDINGNAGTNNITVSLETSGNIDGSATFVMNSNYESITLMIDGTNGFII